MVTLEGHEHLAKLLKQADITYHYMYDDSMLICYNKDGLNTIIVKIKNLWIYPYDIILTENSTLNDFIEAFKRCAA